LGSSWIYSDHWSLIIPRITAERPKPSAPSGPRNCEVRPPWPWRSWRRRHENRHATSILWNHSITISHMQPMVLEYLPTWLGDFWGKCR
jgi:hypothetical protein